jgi:hypothetical protein
MMANSSEPGDRTPRQPSFAIDELRALVVAASDLEPLLISPTQLAALFCGELEREAQSEGTVD